MTDQERYHRARRDPHLVVLEGFHAIKHALRFGADILDMVTASHSDLRVLCNGLAPAMTSAFEAAGELRTAMHTLTPTPPRTGVIAIARRPETVAPFILASTGRAPLVLLDRPRNPGNIGAAVRVAAAAGAGGFITIGEADPWGPAAVRGGAGLQFALPVARISEAHAINALAASPRDVVAVDPDGVVPSPTGQPPSHPAGVPGAILIFGSERDGVSPALLAASARRVRIPMRDGVSSLNLATAVAVMLYAYCEYRT